MEHLFFWGGSYKRKKGRVMGRKEDRRDGMEKVQGDGREGRGNAFSSEPIFIAISRREGRKAGGEGRTEGRTEGRKLT